MLRSRILVASAADPPSLAANAQLPQVNVVEQQLNLQAWGSRGYCSF